MEKIYTRKILVSSESGDFSDGFLDALSNYVDVFEFDTYGKYIIPMLSNRSFNVYVSGENKENLDKMFIALLAWMNQWLEMNNEQTRAVCDLLSNNQEGR